MASAELSEIIGQVVGILEQIKIPYMIVGSVASSYHGTPRTTQDIDIVIAPTSQQLDSLLKRYDDPDAFYVNHETAFKAMHTKSLFNVIDNASGWKLDFIFLKNEPFYIEEFQRRIQVNLYGVRTSISTSEDVVIAKLLWAKMSESERQIRDVADIMKIQEGHLDAAYIENWVNQLAIGIQYQKAKQLMN